jgi:uncharacterized protein YigE (DUF2233 family)
MQNVFDRACNELVPQIMRSGFQMEAEERSYVDGSVSRLAYPMGREQDDYLEVEYGRNNKECVTVQWGENELIIKPDGAGFLVLFQIGLRQTEHFQPHATLDSVFACVLRHESILW